MVQLIPDNLRSDHLFLLVGTNPLPNLIAARLLAHALGCYYLLFSHDTGNVAARLNECLVSEIVAREGIEEDAARQRITMIPLDDPSDARSIADRVNSHLHNSSMAVSARAGLHYAGGTKTMAVHVHETLQAWCGDEKHRHPYVYSYLDPRTIALRFAEGKEIRLKPTDCVLTLPELIGLHGWELGTPQEKLTLPDFCRQLAARLGGKDNLDTLKSWRQWCDWNLRTWSGEQQWRKDWQGFKASERESVLVEWVEAEAGHRAVLEELVKWVQNTKLKDKKRELEWVIPHPALAVPTATLAELRAALEPETGWRDNNDGYERLAAFLDGEWLESYVLDCVQRVARQCEIGSALADLKISREIQGNRVEFQFDVAVMRGFQLFALSCTTSTDRRANKSKLFEVFTRARQMGGDEARVALVGGFNESGRLLQEVQEDWLAPRGMVRIFGPDEWPALHTSLQDWLTPLA